jgi:hypothetical protein
MPSFSVDGPPHYNAVDVHAFNLGGPDADDEACECGDDKRTHGADNRIGTAFVGQKTQRGIALPREFLTRTCGGLIAGTYERAASNDPTCDYQSAEPGSAIHKAVQNSAAQSAFSKAGLYSIQPEDPLQITIHDTYSQAWNASRRFDPVFSCFIGSVADDAQSRGHFGVKPDGTGLDVGTLMPGADGTVCGKKDATNVKPGNEEDMTVA